MKKRSAAGRKDSASASAATPRGEDRDGRQAKVAALRVEQARRERVRRAAAGGGAVLVIAAVAGGVVLAWPEGPPPVAADGEIDGVSTYTAISKHVTTPVTYEQSPPAGGEHSATWLNCGVYGKPVPNENAVHSMEHGAVWLTHRPDLPAEQIRTLEDALPATFGILSPYPNLPAPVVASAWGRQLQLQDPADPRLAQFVRTYRIGKQAPEPGAPCTGGIDVER
ncbi:MAG: DUF3105 domain-containing protein [Sporichthyaceae bacterium]